jgi:hypothetical protein
LINRRSTPARIQFALAARETTLLWSEGEAEVRGQFLTLDGARPSSGLILRCSGEPVGLCAIAARKLVQQFAHRGLQVPRLAALPC